MLNRIDHIGIVVDDLFRSRKFLESLGMTLEQELELPERNVKVAFYRCGDGRIELTQPTTDEGRRTRLGAGNQARIEHLGVEVDSISVAMEAIRGLGVELTADQPVAASGNLNAWTRPHTSEGIQFQLVERDAAGAA